MERNSILDYKNNSTTIAVMELYIRYFSDIGRHDAAIKLLKLKKELELSNRYEDFKEPTFMQDSLNLMLSYLKAFESKP